jgi:hypothetical protein
MTEGLESKRADPPQAAPAEKPFAVSAPAINLPKGGAAMVGMRWGSLGVQVGAATDPGALSTYDSGADNWPFSLLIEFCDSASTASLLVASSYDDKHFQHAHKKIMGIALQSLDFNGWSEMPCH